MSDEYTLYSKSIDMNVKLEGVIDDSDRVIVQLRKSRITPYP